MSQKLAMNAENLEIPFSILDTDLYKLTMQNAVLHHFYDAQVVIKFTNRSQEMLFSKECFEWIRQRVNDLAKLHLSPSERKALQKSCPYFTESYLDYLSTMRLDPVSQVELSFVSTINDKGREMGKIECVIKGPWRDTILYEVPIMSILSEGYFKFVDTDWDYEGQLESAKQKALSLLNPPAPITPLNFSEFGTRRRRSFLAHDIILRGLLVGYDEYMAKGERKGVFVGTSNVFLALKYGVQPVGTIAHEWIMGVGATYGYTGANGRAMDMWEQVYPPGTEREVPLTMLTDTYTADVFFKDFISDPARALRWSVLRQDSGDAFAFVKQAKEVWRRIEDKAGIMRDRDESGQSIIAKGKKIIFSDGLDVQKAIKLQQGCNEINMAASFGIGTFLTNDFNKHSDPSQKSKPLNIVIKLSQINGKECIKLSDDKEKHTGAIEEVQRAQSELGLTL
nr:nicotinate phosphoribosyltransferase [Cryptococcus depauperatus CBS 7841]